MGWNIILKLKQKLFNFDDENFKTYFKLENVLNGVSLFFLKNCSHSKKFLM
jgi:Zn-dependent oligopeptidase